MYQTQCCVWGGGGGGGEQFTRLQLETALARYKHLYVPQEDVCEPSRNTEFPVPTYLLPIQCERFCNQENGIGHPAILGRTIFLVEAPAVNAKV